MVGGDWEGEEEVQEMKVDNPPPPKAKAPLPKPPANKSGGNKIPRMHFESDESSNGALPPSKKKAPLPPSPTATKATPAPKTRPHRRHQGPRPHGGGSPWFGYATPPLPALRAHLVTKGQWLHAIHRVAVKVPENFVPFAGDP